MTDTSPTAETLPAEVRTRLHQTNPGSVLVDTAALDTVRQRFDDQQASTLARYLSSAQSPNTLRAYRADWLTFCRWCLAEGRQSLPADPVDVAVFLAAGAHAERDGVWALSPATLERRAAAIAAVHGAHGLAAPTRSDVVRMTLRGIRRQRRSQPSRKRPVVVDTLEALLDCRPAPGFPGGVTRRRDAWLLLAGFAGALRRSELAGVTCDDITVGAEPATGDPLLVLHLAATKTDPQARRGQQVALPRGRQVRTCPVCAYAAWVEVLEAHHDGGSTAVRTLLDTEARTRSQHRCVGFSGTRLADGSGQPVLRGVNRHGHIADRALTGRSIARIVQRYAASAGEDPAQFGGHSLRAGFATQAALSGAADREIMRQGRWSNARTVHDYIRTAHPLDDNAVTRLGL
ncbi:site-specific integrase [Lipingzhangella sp. LS1_29]|uniref:Site-specific integrase n=1 Tax=Lipingzhangella rawalii TaxID=2055835 RepID=A0ABU2H2M8_9ACTN|nr:site-specific integrase [Lipingzhangella rawalii]MDS1269124.1 site-specific integrase [Lipingzhangella rawalii]